MSDLVHNDVTTDSVVENQNQDVTTTATEDKTDAVDMVSRDEMSRALDDMHKYKRMAKELEEKLKNREVDELKEKQEWQKIAQIKEAEAEESKSKAEKLRDSIIWEKKYSALKDHALKAGIRQEALSDLELVNFDDDLAIETTSTGRVNVLGADQAVNKLRNTRPHWFASKGVNINSNNPEVVGGSGGKVTMGDIFKAEKKAKESGDYAPYYKLMKTYQTQN